MEYLEKLFVLGSMLLVENDYEKASNKEAGLTRRRQGFAAVNQEKTQA